MLPLGHCDIAVVFVAAYVVFEICDRTDTDTYRTLIETLHPLTDSEVNKLLTAPP